MYMKDLIREDIHVNFVVDNARTVHTFEQGSPAAEIWQTVSSSIDERGLRRTELHLQSLDYAKRESRWKPSIPKSSAIYSKIFRHPAVEAYSHSQDDESLSYTSLRQGRTL